MKDQIQRSDSDLIFCDRIIHCWRRLSYFRPAHNELYLPKNRCKLIFMPNIIYINIKRTFLKKISRNPLYHIHIFGRTTVYTYVYDELHFWYLKRVVTQMSRVSSFNVKNVSTWNNAVYYTHENYVFTFVLCLDFKSSGTHKNFRISLTCLVSGFKKTLFFLMSHSYTIKSRDLNLSWNLNFETFHM